MSVVPIRKMSRERKYVIVPNCPLLKIGTTGLKYF
jgi:hypothetical protein